MNKPLVRLSLINETPATGFIELQATNKITITEVTTNQKIQYDFADSMRIDGTVLSVERIIDEDEIRDNVDLLNAIAKRHLINDIVRNTMKSIEEFAEEHGVVDNGELITSVIKTLSDEV